MRYPAVPPAIAILGGSALGAYVHADARAGAAALVLACLVCLVAWRQRDREGVVVAAMLGCALGGLALASVASERAIHSGLRAALAAGLGAGAVSDAPGDPVTLVGCLDRDASFSESGVRLSMRVSQVEVGGRLQRAGGGVLLTVLGDVAAPVVESWRRARTLRLSAQLRRPSRYLNPGVGDDELALARRGTTLVGTVKSAMLVRIASRGNAFAEAAGDLRQGVRRLVDRSIGSLSPRSAAVVRAILLGDRAGLDEETENRLQEAGTYHVLAISGGNIAILAAMLIATGRLARLQPGAAAAMAAAALAGYAYLVGGGASVVRATQMAVLYLLSHAIDHHARPLNAVAASGGVTLAVDPLALFDAGAWLTYGATVAILIGTPLLISRVRSLPLAVSAPAGLLAASVSAEIALFPVSAIVFSRVTGAGLLLNFAAIPLMTVVQIGGMAVVAALVLLPAAAPPLALITHLAAAGLVESARLVDLIPWTVRRVPAPAFAAVAVYYAGWLAWFVAATLAPRWPSRRAFLGWVRRTATAALIGAGAWIVLTPQAWFARRTALEVVFMDVGQGAAALVGFPGTHAMLVDAGGQGGGRFDIGRRVIEPVLWSSGVYRLTNLVATHGDADHLSGAASIVSDFAPDEVWEGVPVPPEPMLQALLAAASRAGASWRTVQRRDEVRLDGVRVVCWHPPPPEWERQRVRNDDSVVVDVRVGDVSITIAGDVEGAAEAEVAELLEPAGVRVLLAPHHGSATSSTWPLLRAASPDLAIISVGRGNRYGHPHPSVLERYRAVGAEVLRTDVDGAISLRSDGRTVEVKTFTGRRLVLRPGRQRERLAPPA